MCRSPLAWAPLAEARERAAGGLRGAQLRGYVFVRFTRLHQLVELQPAAVLQEQAPDSDRDLLQGRVAARLARGGHSMLFSSKIYNIYSELH